MKKEKSCFNCRHKGICKYIVFVNRLYKELEFNWDAFMPERIFYELALHCGEFEEKK